MLENAPKNIVPQNWYLCVATVQEVWQVTR